MSDKINVLISELSINERKILPLLESLNKGDGIKASNIVKNSELEEILVMRALQWLSNKQLITLEKKEELIINLDSNGSLYKLNGLPEKKLLQIIKEKEKNIDQIEKEGLSREEINAVTGLLKKKNAINIRKEKESLVFQITADGEKSLKQENEEEKFLQKTFPLKEKTLDEKEKRIVEELLKRKNILNKEKRSDWDINLTEQGEQILKHKDSLLENVEEKLTSEMLKTKSWKNKKFKRYDIKSSVPNIYGGRKHFVIESMEYIRSIWLELGFEEMQGNQVQSAFWDLDALFVPQDHPARELQDTFYLDKKSDLDFDMLKKVKRVHENGGTTGSKGWQTKYSKDIARETLLRTHTTVISAHTLANLKKEDLPKKFFIIGKVFRNETVDWKHLFEFHQVDGIVVDPDGDLMKLKGYLKEFFSKMGFIDVRIRPAHFPYTEPSAEIEAYHPIKKQWVEMGGCGIFRPEVTKTLLGFECPVLAWGIGMERIILSYYNLTELRQIYSNDIQDLKTKKLFLK